MRRMRTSIIPVVVRALGQIGEDSDKLIEGISGSPYLKNTNYVLTNTAYTLGNLISVKYA